MNLTIRRAVQTDLDEIGRLYDELNCYLERTVNYPGWKYGVYPTRADAAAAVEEGTLYLAKDGQTAAGTMILRHRPEQGYPVDGWQVFAGYDRIYVLYTLAVAPDYLGCGVATRLLAYAEELARAEGCVAIRLDVAEKNTPAQALYRKAGYHFICKADLGYGAIGIPWFELYEKQIKPERL